MTPAHEEQLLSREDRLGLAEYIVNRAKEANRLKELGRDELQVSENLADLIKKGKLRKIKGQITLKNSKLCNRPIAREWLNHI